MRPPSVVITPEILRLISQLDEFKGLWKAMRTLSPEKLTHLRKVATVESVGSSTRIEGARLTDRQVEAMLGRLHITQFKTRDEQEVAGYAYVPYSSLESIIEDSKEGYYRALRRTQTTLNTKSPDWEAWLLFFIRSLVKQKDALAAKLAVEETRAAELTPLAQKIAGLLRDHETLTLSQTVDLVHGKPSTVKLRLRELIDKGYLEMRGQGRGAHYVRRIGQPDIPRKQK